MLPKIIDFHLRHRWFVLFGLLAIIAYGVHTMLQIPIEAFPDLTGEDRPGIVSFTATRWRQLLKPKKMPEGEPPPTPVDCYRFVLSNPSVDVCMMGAKNLRQMRENLSLLEMGPMSEEELERMKRIGDHVHAD